jgi:hypothetical protein
MGIGDQVGVRLYLYRNASEITSLNGLVTTAAECQNCSAT